MLGGAQVPEGILNAICQSFDCLPSEALKEDPQVIQSVLEYRMAYQAKEGFNNKSTDMPQALQELWVKLTEAMTEKGYLNG